MTADRAERPAAGPLDPSQADRDIDVLVLGEVNPDIIVTDPDPVPMFGEIERIVGSVRMTVGSSSAIFACGAARLGLRVAFRGVVGDDPFGRFMLDAMADRGIDVSACTVDPARPTGATVVLTNGRDRAILTAFGAIGALDVADVPASMIGRARHVHVGAFYLQGASRDRLPGLFAAARGLGVTTSFDSNWDPTERWDGGIGALLQATDVFLPNDVEARRIAGIDDVDEAARALAAAGSRGRTDGGPVVAVKLGAAGAMACRADGPVIRVPSIPTAPVDTTGAGDSFDAGFVYAWLEGGSLRDCLELGVACGSVSTRAAGGVDGQASLAEARLAVDSRSGG